MRPWPRSLGFPRSFDIWGTPDCRLFSNAANGTPLALLDVEFVDGNCECKVGNLVKFGRGPGVELPIC